MRKLRAMPLFVIALAIMLLGGILTLALPKASYSEMENRMLAQTDSLQPFTNGFDQRVETYISDHFPGRVALVRMQSSLQGILGQRLQGSTLLGRGGRLFEVPPQQVTRIARSSIQTLQETQEELQLPMTLMLLPTSAQYLKDELPPLYQPADQQPLIAQLYDSAEGITCVDAGFARSEKPNGLYYRTDHHLTADGAWLVYTQLMERWDMAPEQPPLREVNGFLGSYYNRLPAMSVEEETFSVYLPDSLSLTLDAQEQNELLDPVLVKGSNKYAALLGRPVAGSGGNDSAEALLSRSYGHATITGGHGDESLLILSDSYINAIAPLLAQHFARVDIIDPRYFGDSLEQVVKESHADRILALFGLNSINVNSSLSLMSISEGEDL